MTPHELAYAVLADRGIRPFSLIGGTRMQSLIAEAVARDRRDYPRVIARTTTVYTDEDWALDFDEESGEEAWWIEMQLHDPATRDADIRDQLAVLSLSDVEAEKLIGALQDMITTGRRTFR